MELLEDGLSHWDIYKAVGIWIELFRDLCNLAFLNLWAAPSHYELERL